MKSKFILVVLVGIILSGCVGVSSSGIFGTGVTIALDPRSLGTQIDDSVMQKNLAARLILREKDYLISVSTKVLDGRIFLTGSVDYPEEKLFITKLAWETKGARSVKNDIKNSKPNLIISGILCGDDFELEFSKVDKEELLYHLNSGKDYCLDRKTGLYYHPGVTMALSEEISTVGSKDGFWFVQKDVNDNWKEFDFQTSSPMPSHIAKFL